MPYISRSFREDLLTGKKQPQNPGELNFLITSIINKYLLRGDLRYNTINEVIGALECAKQELYRRVVGPYEDRKCQLNSDVYSDLLICGK